MQETTIASVMLIIFSVALGAAGYVVAKHVATDLPGENTDVCVVIGCVGGAIFGAIWATAILLVSNLGRRQRTSG